MRRVAIAGLLALCPVAGVAEVLDTPPGFLTGQRWASAEICGPDAYLTGQDDYDAYAGDTALVFLDEYGLAMAAEPVFCSFHTILGGPLAADGVYVAHLVCAGADGFDSLLTLALIHAPETVGDTTETVTLRDQARVLDQTLFLCPPE